MTNDERNPKPECRKTLSGELAGFVIRILSFLRILDEGHKAYSENAQRTLRNLNPCTIVELSDTPPKEANKLVVISVKFDPMRPGKA